MTGFHALKLGAILPAALMLAAPAYAQKAGTYTGTNNEGDTVEVVVAEVNGSLAVTGMSDGGTVYCKGQNGGGWGVGVGLSGQAIVDKKATIQVLAVNLYFDSQLKFKGDGVSGTINFSVPEFFGTKEPPKTACAGATKKQTFTATIGGAEAKAPVPNTAYAQPFSEKP